MWYIPIALLFSCTPVYVFCCETLGRSSMSFRFVLMRDLHQTWAKSNGWWICACLFCQVFLRFCFFLQFVKLNFGIIKGQWKLSEMNWWGGFRTGSHRVLRKSLLWKKKKLMKVVVQYLTETWTTGYRWAGRVWSLITPFQYTLGFFNLLCQNCGFLFNLFSLFYSLIFGGCSKWSVSLWIFAVWFWYCCTLYCVINMFIPALEAVG